MFGIAYLEVNSLYIDSLNIQTFSTYIILLERILKHNFIINHLPSSLFEYVCLGGLII